jgi:glycosyltransferase involved in cell wall biosynthesis
MRILLLTKHLNLGGIPRYVVNLAKGLKERNCDVMVASSGGILVPELINHNIPHITVPINTKSIFSPRVLIGILALTKRLKNRPIDIIHSHTRVTSFMANLLAKLIKSKHITTVHGIYKKKLLRKIFPLLPLRIIAVSFETKKRLMEWEGISESRIEVIPNAVDVEYFLNYNCTKQEARQKLNLDKNAFIIGNVSRIEKIKGQEMIVRAFVDVKVEINNCKLIFIGEGKYKSTLIAMAEKLGVSRDILFLGGKTDIRPYLRAMDVFCFTPYEEPFGIVILEAMAMGLPVIATTASDIPIITEDGNCGLLIPPGDSKSLKNAILKLYHDPHKREELSLKGLNRAKEIYSLPRLVRDVLKAYHKLLEA